MTKQENIRLKEAFQEQSKYCYNGTDVLKNKLGLTDPKELNKAETSLTLLRLTKLHIYGMEMSFEFTVKYYLSIHRYLFQDLYDFAGQTRNENITKGNTPFCRPEFIYNYLSDLLKKMRIKLSKIENKEDLIEYLAYYYSEINVVHPFREGNGRVLREYLRQLVEFYNKNKETNYELDYSDVTDLERKNLIDGSIISACTGDISLLKEFFASKLIEHIKRR